MIKKDNYYYWRHPDEYERLTADRLNNEAVLNVLEFAMTALREEIDQTVTQLKISPNNEGFLLHAIGMIRDLKTNYIENVTFGRNDVLIQEIEDAIPRGVNRVELEEKYDRMEREKRSYAKKRRKPNWNKREIVDNGRGRGSNAS